MQITCKITAITTNQLFCIVPKNYYPLQTLRAKHLISRKPLGPNRSQLPRASFRPFTVTRLVSNPFKKYASPFPENFCNLTGSDSAVSTSTPNND